MNKTNLIGIEPAENNKHTVTIMYRNGREYCAIVSDIATIEDYLKETKTRNEKLKKHQAQKKLIMLVKKENKLT